MVYIVTLCARATWIVLQMDGPDVFMNFTHACWIPHLGSTINHQSDSTKSWVANYRTIILLYYIDPNRKVLYIRVLILLGWLVILSKNIMYSCVRYVVCKYHDSKPSFYILKQRNLLKVLGTQLTSTSHHFPLEVPRSPAVAWSEADRRVAQLRDPTTTPPALKFGVLRPQTLIVLSTGLSWGFGRNAEANWLFCGTTILGNRK